MVKKSWIADPKNLRSVFECAPQVLTVVEIHSKYNSKDIRGMAPKLCSQIKEIDIKLVKQALTIYQNKTKRDGGKPPHPNYFISTCKRLSQDQKETGIITHEPPLIIGKTI